jgi:hypothetical protein
MQETYVFERTERRVPMAVAVKLSGYERTPDVEMTFTENVSSRGARVFSKRRWRQDAKVQLISLPGHFQARSRVAYCQPVDEGFAIGVEFLEPQGQWVVPLAAAPERTLNG